MFLLPSQSIYFVLFYETPSLSSVLKENQSHGGTILGVSLFCCSYIYKKVIDFTDFLLAVDVVFQLMIPSKKVEDHFSESGKFE